jgi:hypothetical protein
VRSLDRADNSHSKWRAEPALLLLLLNALNPPVRLGHFLSLAGALDDAS